MAEKTNWSCICKKAETNIFTAVFASLPGNTRWVLSFIFIILSATLLLAQTFSRQKIVFSLFDKQGKQLTAAAISSGQVKVYSLREAKTITHSHLSFDKKSKLFTFSESAISPGMRLAFISGADTMFVSLYGRAFNNRTIKGIRVQPGSYVLTSNEFAGQQQLQVKDWRAYLEDELAPQQQDLTAYRASLKGKKPVGLVSHTH